MRSIAALLIAGALLGGCAVQPAAVPCAPEYVQTGTVCQGWYCQPVYAATGRCLPVAPAYPAYTTTSVWMSFGGGGHRHRR